MTDNDPTPSDSVSGPEPAHEHDRQAQPVDDEEPPRLPFAVVGIGASAGGLEAYSAFLDAMPPDTGMAFVLVQHLPPDRESLLVDILAKRTRMPVLQVVDAMPVESNHVYVIRPGHTLTLREGLLHLGASLRRPGHNRPIDDFFKSLAEEQRERAIAIVMSGMGSNGTAGAQVIKAVGGLCIAQDPSSAQFPSMPEHLIEQGYADLVLRPHDMPIALLGYARHPYARDHTSSDALADRDRREVDTILGLLRARTRQDFRGYKQPTIVRRIQRRMGFNQIKDLGAYAQAVRQSPSEASALSDDLLIHVTGFFRDPDAWETLKRLAIEPLVAERESNTPIRCWVTACSSGEEAYSLAILIAEAAQEAGKRFDVKVFATDMAQRALVHARTGVYPNGIEAEVTPERLARHFRKEDDVYQVTAELRDMVVFAPQNLLHDPPFSRIDLCSCRNLLIYLEPEVQQRVLAFLHFGLRESGVLFLGTSETIAGTDDLFEPIDKRWRIFRRVGATRHGAVDFPVPRSVTLATSAASMRAPGVVRRSVAQLTTHALLERYTPASVTVDREGRVAYFHGETERYLAQPRGEPTRELLQLVREGLRGVVREVIAQAIAEGALARKRGPLVETSGGLRRVWVTAAPLDARAAPGFLLVTFDAWSEPDVAEVAGDEPGEAMLRDELRRARGDLQHMIVELQSSNEELRASNEEITSINEELQSTNEELETSKEELQSLNEELTTVNAQLRAKSEENEATSNDLASLLSSTDIAVVFLDTEFRIRRYTPAVADLIDLIPADVGRPLANLALKFVDPDLLLDAEGVLERLVPREAEIRSRNGRWYIRRLLPYRTSDRRIDGVVITFVDITARKHSELDLAEKARLLDLSGDAIIVRDLADRIIYWSRGATEHYGWTADEAVGREMCALLHVEDEPSLPELVDELRQREHLVSKVVHVARNGRRITTLCRWAVDRGPSGEPHAVLTIGTDVTEREHAEGVLRERDEQLRLLVEGACDFAMLSLDPQGRITTWNVGAERLFGHSEAEALGQNGALIFTAEDRAARALERECEQAERDGRAEDKRWHSRKDGTQFFGNGVLTALRGPGGVLRGFVKVLRDETARKLADEAIKDAALQSETANRMKDEFLARVSHELRTPLGAITMWTHILEQDTETPAMRAKAIGAIKRSARAQNDLIGDLIDTSRITAGTLRVTTELVDLGALVASSVEVVRPAAEGKGVRLEFGLRGDVGTVTTAPDRLTQVVNNVLTNAVKFTPQGGRVEVTLEHHDGCIELRVTDTGKGIEPAFLRHVFEPFRQADASSTRAAGGLGLGLAISKQLVELLGGTIHVESAGPGRGASFIIRLPMGDAPHAGSLAALASERPPPGDAGPSLAGVHVLLVDDTAEAREAMALVLSNVGARVTAVDSAAAAFEAFRRETPDVLVSDITMPGEDGHSLLRRVRADEAARGAARVPALAVTALARDDDRESALEAGFDRHVAKPLAPAWFIETVHEMVARSDASRPPEGA